MDRVNPIVLDALKHAVRVSEPSRLYRSGKLPGLFSSRAGSAGEAAAWCIREGLVEVVRTETRGKIVTEWVRATAKGTSFLHQHESPLETLRELRELLSLTTAGLPEWIAGMNHKLEELAQQWGASHREWSSRLEAMHREVESALLRLHLGEVALPGRLSQAVPWATQAICYLEERRRTEAPNPCTLSELFSAVALRHAQLNLTEFHQGLRCLRDAKLVSLLEGRMDSAPLPEPEYALLENGLVLSAVALARD